MHFNLNRGTPDYVPSKEKFSEKIRQEKCDTKYMRTLKSQNDSQDNATVAS